MSIGIDWKDPFSFSNSLGKKIQGFFFQVSTWEDHTVRCLGPFITPLFGVLLTAFSIVGFVEPIFKSLGNMIRVFFPGNREALDSVKICLSHIPLNLLETLFYLGLGIFVGTLGIPATLFNPKFVKQWVVPSN